MAGVVQHREVLCHCVALVGDLLRFAPERRPHLALHNASPYCHFRSGQVLKQAGRLKGLLTLVLIPLGLYRMVPKKGPGTFPGAGLISVDVSCSGGFPNLPLQASDGAGDRLLLCFLHVQYIASIIGC